MTGVNRPTNVRARDADIDQKLQLFGIATAFSNGKMPANDQIDATLNSFIASKALSNPSSKLSSEGRALVGDVREVVEQAKQLVLSKNEGNLLQEFIYKTSKTDLKSINASGGPVTKDDAKQDGQNALEGIKTLGKLLVTNGQFRKLLKDASILLRDMGADSATKIASKTRPSEEELSQVDEPAPDHTWHDLPTKEEIKKRTDDYKKRGQSVYQKKKKQAEEGADASELAEPVDPAIESAQNKTAEYRDRTKNYLETKVPKERQDQAIMRLKKMIIECQQNPDYQKAIQTLLGLAEKYHGHAKTTTANSSGAVKEGRSRLASAEADLKLLIERFANGTSTDNLWSSINSIYKAADSDAELSGWFKNLDVYIRRCLQEDGYILQESSTTEWNKLSEQGKYFIKDKYKTQFDGVSNEVKFLGEQFDKDPQNRAFGNSVQKLFKNLGSDANGKIAFKPHLLKDITNVVLPSALESLHYVPIPRIEYSDKQVDAVIENLVIESDNLTPNVFEIYNNNYVSWGRKLGRVGKNKHAIEVNVSGIQMDMRNVSYYVRRKQGFPSITDLGIISILLGGQGFGFKLGLSTADASSRNHFFKVDKVDVDIDHLKLTLHKSSHKLLFALVKPLLLRSLRPVLKKVLEKAIRDNFNEWDATLYSIKQDADRSATVSKSVDADAAVPNSYNRFFDAAKTRYNANKEKKKKEAEAKKAKADDKKLNIAYTKDDSIFPSIVLPGGFTTRASEYKALGQQGEGWKSPVFTIGKAGASNNLAKAPLIEKKLAGAANGTTGTNGANVVNGNGVAGGNYLNGNGIAGTNIGTNGAHTANGTNGAGYI
ncbi:hypothetical protein F503_01287 [Ophiostoma piceae UAMH 11346]|uniref:Bactericidal permeability-increasing protein n=1 Tax=Ophiostoma piceae (strain UAMH 11346) TaxID=1262450 RepID=S3CDC0_OPHP1|nr:hypothetical protein F503_01287 [Ophiostoma piceae UAMH 11346]